MRSKNISQIVPMSNRFEFLFTNSDPFTPCPCSAVGPWSYQPHRKQMSERGSKRNNADKGKKTKITSTGRTTSIKGKSVTSYIWRSTAKSSFIGLSKIATSTSRFGKLVWVFMTIFCLVGFLYQTLKFALVYQSSPTEVVLRVENNGKANFPAVTVCNNNRIRKSGYCEYNPQSCNTDEDLILSDSQILDTFIDGVENYGAKFKTYLGHSMTMIKGCYFNGRIKHLNITECLKMFRPFFDPDFGNCFKFQARDNDGMHLSASEADFWDNVNDLVLLLDQEGDEYTEAKRQQGLVITVHSDEYIPDIHTDGIQVEPGSYYAFAVQQSVTKLLPPPYQTNCTDFPSLPWVSKHAIPSSRICTVGCSRHFQLIECRYVTRNLSLFYDERPWDDSKITKEQELCAASVEEKTKTYCRSLCGVPCIDIAFEVSVGKTRLQKVEVMEFYGNEEIPYHWRNLILLKVFYKTVERKMYEHSAMYDDLELFSYLGGYSGVWLGFSLLNLFELLEILVVSLISGCRSKSSNRMKQHGLYQGSEFQSSEYRRPSKLKVLKRKKKRKFCCNC